MKILIRADASQTIGTGHVIRCLALAHELKAHQHEVDFLSLPLEGNLISTLISQGFTVIQNPTQSYDLCIVDHYDLTAEDEHQFRRFSKKIMAIDDWTERVHDADLILDPSISTKSQLRKTLNSPAAFLGGPEWLLLRKEFSEVKKSTLPRTEFKTVLIFFGGTDPQDQIIHYYSHIKNLNLGLKFQFLVSEQHPRADEFKNLALPNHIHFYFSPPSVAELMKSADVYLGSSGTVTWERMCLGLTGLVVSIIDNQVDNARTSHELGYHIDLGRHTEVSPEMAIQALEKLLQTPEDLITMSRKCFQQVDGLAAERFVRDILPNLILS